jgi:hypothetical protein
MPRAPSPIPPLAGAFLALGDGDPAGDPRRGPRTRAAAVLGALAIAAAAPLAWSSPNAPRHRDAPAATLTSKSALSPGDDDAAA